MTIAIPKELEDELRAKAAERQAPPEQLLQQALEWYFRLDPELLDEFTAWQEVRDEAWELVEGEPL